MELRRLSSRLTFFNKVIFPLVWGGFWGLGTFFLFRQGNSEAWGFFGAWCVAMVLFALVLFPLKVVATNGKNLVVSNFLRSVTIPLSEVQDIREFRWVNPCLVRVRFCSETAFGRGITFTPQHEFFAFFRDHEVTQELRALVEIARRPSEKLPSRTAGG